MSVLVRSASAMVLAGAALLGSSAIAASQPPPPAQNCSLADQAGILSGVSASLSAYMFTHPDANWFFTSLRGLPPEERRAKVDSYLDTYDGKFLPGSKVGRLRSSGSSRREIRS